MSWMCLRKRNQSSSRSAWSAASAGSTAVEEQALTKAATRAGRRRLAAQNSLFDLANQKVVDELRAADVEKMSDSDAKAMLEEMKKKLV